jgi:hypothetical protein
VGKYSFSTLVEYFFIKLSAVNGFMRDFKVLRKRSDYSAAAPRNRPFESSKNEMNERVIGARPPTPSIVVIAAVPFHGNKRIFFNDVFIKGR